MDPATAAALRRYRIIAYIVGAVLLVLVLVAVPLKYLAHSPGLVAVVGPIHGFLYIVYLLAAAALALRCRWSIPRTVLVMLAGTVPFLTFVAEHNVTQHVRRAAAPSATS